MTHSSKSGNFLTRDNRQATILCELKIVQKTVCAFKDCEYFLVFLLHLRTSMLEVHPKRMISFSQNLWLNPNKLQIALRVRVPNLEERLNIELEGKCLLKRLFLNVSNRNFRSIYIEYKIYSKIRIVIRLKFTSLRKMCLSILIIPKSTEKI